MSEERQYHATFILNTRQWEDSNEALLDRIKEQMEALGVTVEKVEKMGQKPFARVTEKSNPDGLYSHFQIKGLPDVPEKIQERFRLEKSVKRILIETT